MSPFTRRRALRGATSTETVFATVAVAVALLFVVTLFGRRISNLLRGASAGMDAGRGVASGGSAPGNSELSGEAPTGMHAYVPGQPVFPPLDKDFSDAEKKKIELILSTLPPGLDLPINKVVRIPDASRNAWYNTEEDNLYLGRAILYPDSAGGYNDYNEKMLGVDFGYTTERILYHEMMHAWGDNNAAAASDFISKGNYSSRRNKLLGSSEYTDAVGNRDILILQYEQEAKEAGMKVEDYMAAHPEKQKELLAANQAISAAMEKNGFPSRFPGDNHAATDEDEYFAILLEIHRYAPSKFDDYVKRGIVTQAQVDWINAHQELY